MRLSDTLWGVILLALAIALIVSGSRYEPIAGQSVGAGTFPVVLGAALSVCSALLAVRGWTTRNPSFAWSAWVRSWPHLSNFLVVTACLTFLATAMNRLGYHLTLVIAMTIMLRKLGTPLGRSAAFALLVTLVTHVLFYKLLRVPLPWGPLPIFY